MSRIYAVDAFRERLEAGDPVATAIRDVVELHGLHLMLYHYELLPNGIGCVRILEQIHREGWPGALWEVLDYIMARDTGSKERFSEANIRAAYCEVRDRRIDKFLEESSQTKGPATHSATNESPAEPVEPHSNYNRPAGGVQEENEAMTDKISTNGLSAGTDERLSKLIPDASFAWMPIDALEIDLDYQRRLRIERVEEMVKAFRRYDVGVLYVNRRADGRYVVFDGQHRLAAMRRLEIKHLIPCFIYQELEIETEAHTFKEQNKGRSNLTPYEVHNAEVKGGVLLHAVLEEAIQSLGFCWSGGDHRDAVGRKLNCPGTIIRIADEHGTDRVQWILSVLRNAWAEKAQAYRAELIEALDLIIEQYGDDLDLARLSRQLQQKQPGELRREAVGLHHANTRSIVSNLAALIVRLYNKGLRNRLPDWSL